MPSGVKEDAESVVLEAFEAVPATFHFLTMRFALILSPPPPPLSSTGVRVVDMSSTQRQCRPSRSPMVRSMGRVVEEFSAQSRADLVCGDVEALVGRGRS
jgi:hypothetical protein